MQRQNSKKKLVWVLTVRSAKYSQAQLSSLAPQFTRQKSSMLHLAPQSTVWLRNADPMCTFFTTNSLLSGYLCQIRWKTMVKLRTEWKRHTHTPRFCLYQTSSRTQEKHFTICLACIWNTTTYFHLSKSVRGVEASPPHTASSHTAFQGTEIALLMSQDFLSLKRGYLL